MDDRMIHKRFRIDAETEMRIRELAEILGVSQSAVIRILIKNSILQLHDKDGYWYSEQISKCEDDRQDAT